MKNRINDVPVGASSAGTLWDGNHKIPWNDPAFSARILKEHLSQDHHLASRKQAIIDAQAAWIHSRFLGEPDASILDLGCGPGLYSRVLAGDTHSYLGLDFSPASIDYAIRTFGVPGRVEFRLGDVVEASFGQGHSLAMMLYGELNVFPPDQCRRILAKAYAALAPGGVLLVERQRFDAVKGVGQGITQTTRAPQGGLFSGKPYVCLTENHWFDGEGVALQRFTVQEEGAARNVVYRSTTKAWTGQEMAALLSDAGFMDVAHHKDWPVPDDGLALTSGRKR